MSSATDQLDAAILAFIERGERDEAAFNALALQVFAYQVERNTPYRTLCQQRGVTPATVTHWSQIPPVPTHAFKVLPLACEPVEQAQAIFLSSGTTRGATARSRHFVFNLRLYEASVLRWFEPHLLPERRPMPTAILFPPPDELPYSSLGHMLLTIANKWAAGFRAQDNCWFIRGGKLLAEELAARLRQAEAEGTPMMLLGTSFSFVHFLDWCAQTGATFRLPEGSRLMDTGGFKGRSREVARDELLRLYERVLGISPEHCVNEYGMAELSSQFYDGVVGQPYCVPDAIASRNAHLSPRYHLPPPWVRTKVVHPETLQEVAEGERGLLCHYDLANRGSVMAVLTEDVGIKVGDGFVLLGRAHGSELRGCSVLVDELLSGGMSINR
ncbi:hypothetical protein HRbin17_01346 [bacterium HR17]|uniref:Acyl-protein synthetase LuxE domain-containing protein n=1 Tax=Candidatus Fervidibacter japonicus TaxID=2035412 RepID=A0A2H5XCA5_9BACT|nr:hypothetical protein HRbin17_01346 [bacterium HR17]